MLVVSPLDICQVNSIFQTQRQLKLLGGDYHHLLYFSLLKKGWQNFVNQWWFVAVVVVFPNWWTVTKINMEPLCNGY